MDDSTQIEGPKRDTATQGRPLSGQESAGAQADSPAAAAQGATAGAPAVSGKGCSGGRLVDLALASGVELFHDGSGTAFALVPLGEGRRVEAVQSSALSSWLAVRAWEQLGVAPGGGNIAAAQRVLAGLAGHEGLVRHLHVRSAWHDGMLWIDLDGANAVRVEPGRWEVVARPSVLFRPLGRRRPVPTPVAGGEPHEILERFVHLPDWDYFFVFVGLVAAAFVPGLAPPLIQLCGPWGSGRTTAGRIFTDLVDPCPSQGHGLASSRRALEQLAAGRRLLFIDEMAAPPPWLEDALLHIVSTGCGVLLVSAEPMATRAELIERSVVFELEPLPLERRESPHALWADYEAARPRIFGSIFEVLAEAMGDLDAGDVPPGVALREYGMWASACAEQAGLALDTFWPMLLGSMARQTRRAAEASPVAQAVGALLAEKPDWSGTAAVLLEALEQVARAARIDARGDGWPRSASWLVRRLNELERGLAAMGIKVALARTAEERTITLRRTSGMTGAETQTAPASGACPAGR